MNIPFSKIRESSKIYFLLFDFLEVLMTSSPALDLLESHPIWSNGVT